MHHYLAVDLGAESGRVIRGSFDGQTISLDECARFPTGITELHGRCHWDILRIYDEIKKGLRTAASKGEASGIAIDSWGVDFALLDETDRFLGFPYAYRDPRTEGMLEKLDELQGHDKIYEKTGIAFMPFNTINQLLAMAQADDPWLKLARNLLFVPDIFNFMLSGVKTSEFTFATTSQLLNVHSRDWDRDLFNAIGIDPGIMQKVVSPGTVIGPLLKEHQEATGLGAVPLIAPACHDTASAIAAIPMENDRCCYISSGTWCLMGVENREAITTPRAKAANFTNEGGVGSTYRFLKNIMGLWLIQRLKDEFDEDLDYGTLTETAEASMPFRTLVDATSDRFFNPKSMKTAMADFAKETQQPVPESPGEFIRCALESLALEYRTTLDELRDIIGRPIEKMHLTGGGVKNRLLCQMTANATNLPLIAGPIEATATGNIMMQAIALGHIKNVQEGRAIVAKSFQVEELLPQSSDQWQQAYQRYLSYKPAPK